MLLHFDCLLTFAAFYLNCKTTKCNRTSITKDNRKIPKMYYMLQWNDKYSERIVMGILSYLYPETLYCVACVEMFLL